MADMNTPAPSGHIEMVGELVGQALAGSMLIMQFDLSAGELKDLEERVSAMIHDNLLLICGNRDKKIPVTYAMLRQTMARFFRLSLIELGEPLED